MSSLLKKLSTLLFFSFLLLVNHSPVNAQYIGTCDEEIGKSNANDWLYSQKEFTTVPPPVPEFYDPYISGSFPPNAPQDTSMLPNPDNLACLINFAEAEWQDKYGTNFNKQGVEQVINFAIKNQYNPSLLLALWAEETHGGDLSVIELGCGAVDNPQNKNLSGQFDCLANRLISKVRYNNFTCFLCGYAGDCELSFQCKDEAGNLFGDPDNVITNPDFIYVIQYYNYLTKGVIPGDITTPPSANLPTDFDKHPLRPFPGEDQGQVNPDQLTTYCAMRPVAVEMNEHDVREPMITIKTQGNMTLDFTSFITPLLSVTDPKSPDYQLPYNQKAQRYLLDFLEGRAYYEAMLEPTNPTSEEQRDIWNRLGVFRKMTPKVYQDKLKRAVIKRATGTFQNNDNPYGFTPTTNTLHNYIVGYWNHNTHQLAEWETNIPIYLRQFENNWAPLSDDFETTEEYQQKYTEWFEKDYGMWSSLWPYVPMFTREDSKGYIQVIDDTGAPGPQISTPQQTEVSHPHLARAYEVSTSLSYFLTPSSVHPEVAEPFEEIWYTPAPWWSEDPWWMDPVIKKPHSIPFDPGWGPICDFKEEVPLISTSGDPALDDTIKVSLNRQDIVKNPKYQPLASHTTTDNCGTHHTCEKCVEDKHKIPGTYSYEYTYTLDDSGCFYYKDAFYTPNYLVTYTPYLKGILDSLFQSKRAVFDLLIPFDSDSEESLAYKDTDWPGVGNPSEDSPQFDYTALNGSRSHAQAGYHKPGDTQSYPYRYLGNIQCAKEKVISILQPFFTGEEYIPYAPECFPNAEDNLPAVPSGEKWLVWPHAGSTPTITSCYGKRCWQNDDKSLHSGNHPGLDTIQSYGSPITAAAPGTVYNTGHSDLFGYYVVIQHSNGWFTLYAHLQNNLGVTKSKSVTTKTIVGYQGNSGAVYPQPTQSNPYAGSHLHFGLAKGGSLTSFMVGGSHVDPCPSIQGCDCSATDYNDLDKCP